MEKICGLVHSGSRVGLWVYFDGNFWRVDCHFVDEAELKIVTLVTWPVCDRWKEEVIGLTVTVLSCLDPLPNFCSVVVDTLVAVGRSLAHFTPAGKSVVMRFNDVQLLQRSIRQQFCQRIGGLDPYNVLEFLKYRLSSVVYGSVFDRMPLLRQVLHYHIRFWVRGVQLVWVLSSLFRNKNSDDRSRTKMLGRPNVTPRGLNVDNHILFTVRAKRRVDVTAVGCCVWRARWTLERSGCLLWQWGRWGYDGAVINPQSECCHF